MVLNQVSARAEQLPVDDLEAGNVGRALAAARALDPEPIRVPVRATVLEHPAQCISHSLTLPDPISKLKLQLAAVIISVERLIVTHL